MYSRIRGICMLVGWIHRCGGGQSAAAEANLTIPQLQKMRNTPLSLPETPTSTG
jgi:hypothetical protein